MTPAAAAHHPTAQPADPEEPPMLQTPPPASPDARHALHLTLIRRYTYLTLKLSSPLTSPTGRWEASWNGGHATADTEEALLAAVLEKLQDCGSDGHLWETTGDRRSPADSDNIILTQRLVCAYCDEKERAITLYHPGPTATESSRDQNP